MTVSEQVKIMEGQLSAFNSLMEKMQYLNKFFDCDPQYTKEARDIVRSNICKSL
jgi:DNA-directed RNA polymerase subunit F